MGREIGREIGRDRDWLLRVGTHLDWVRHMTISQFC
ncbi:MAG: hypothetical protein ACI9HK_005142 [Pirellulaceae bacterium]